LKGLDSLTYKLIDWKSKYPVTDSFNYFQQRVLECVQQLQQRVLEITIPIILHHDLKLSLLDMCLLSNSLVVINVFILQIHFDLPLELHHYLESFHLLLQDLPLRLLNQVLLFLDCLNCALDVVFLDQRQLHLSV